MIFVKHSGTVSEMMKEAGKNSAFTKPLRVKRRWYHRLAYRIGRALVFWSF